MQTTCRFEEDNCYFLKNKSMDFDCKLVLKKVSEKFSKLHQNTLQFASKMQSKLYQKCMQNDVEIVCKNSVQIVLQKLHFLCIKKGVVK